MSKIDIIGQNGIVDAMNISLDKHQTAYISHKLKAGGYRNAAEVVREALRKMEAEDEAATAGMDALEAQLLAGLASKRKLLGPDYFKAMRAKAAARLKRRAA